MGKKGIFNSDKRSQKPFSSSHNKSKAMRIKIYPNPPCRREKGEDMLESKEYGLFTQARLREINDSWRNGMWPTYPSLENRIRECKRHHLGENIFKMYLFYYQTNEASEKPQRYNDLQYHPSLLREAERKARAKQCLGTSNSSIGWAAVIVTTT